MAPTACQVRLPCSFHPCTGPFLSSRQASIRSIQPSQLVSLPTPSLSPSVVCKRPAAPSRAREQMATLPSHPQAPGTAGQVNTPMCTTGRVGPQAPVALQKMGAALWGRARAWEHSGCPSTTSHRLRWAGRLLGSASLRERSVLLLARLRKISARLGPPPAVGRPASVSCLFEQPCK